MSTAYYALFHQVCEHFSRIVFHPQGDEFRRAFIQAYRHIDHGTAKRQCEAACDVARTFPSELIQFAEVFVSLQQQRAEADYEPFRIWTDAEVEAIVNDAEQAIDAFESATTDVSGPLSSFSRCASANATFDSPLPQQLF